jgi:hypothetical protein
LAFSFAESDSRLKVSSFAGNWIVVMGSLSRDLDLPYVAAKAAVELDGGFSSGDGLPGLRSLRQYLQQWVSAPVFPWLPEALRKELLLDRRFEQDSRLNASSDVEQAVQAACDEAGLQHVREEGGLRAVAQVVLDTLDRCMPDEFPSSKGFESPPSEPKDGHVPNRSTPLAPLPSKDAVVKFCVSLSSEILESQQQFADGSEVRFYF